MSRMSEKRTAFAAEPKPNRAKRVQCVELAPAFEPRHTSDSGSKLHALHTLGETRPPYAPMSIGVPEQVKQSESGSRPPHRPIRHLRWWIGGLLFAMTVINYIDRQTINVLAPILKKEHQWTNSDFAWLLIS